MRPVAEDAMPTKRSNDTAPGRSSLGVHHVETESVPAKDRFEYWRSLFGGVDMAPVGDRDRPFRGSLTHFSGHHDIQFRHLQVDPLDNRFCATPSEGMVLLTQILDGRVELTDRASASIVATGGLYLTDTSRGARVRHSRYSIAHLRLPRTLVLDVLGRVPVPSRAGRSLGNQCLAPFLSAQIALLSARGATLDPRDRAIALNASVDLALAILRAQLDARPSDRDVAAQGVFAAARMYIDHHCHRVDLAPDHIARALGCSRSRLYRIFAQRGEAVFEVIRETRLQRSLELLRASPAPSITDVAFESGFADLSTFNRAFKRRYGLTPREWRERALSA